MMFDLIKSELLRFRSWAVALAAVHLMALGFMARVVDLAQQSLNVHWVVGGVYALVGLLFGAYQLGSYRKPSQWLNLLHRPLPPQRIAAALAIASASLLVLAVAVPLLLVALWQETMTARVVDLRHWLLPLSGWLIALCAWLAGAFCALRGARLAGSALVLLFWLIASHAHGFGLLAVEGIALVWLLALLLGAFQPNLSAPPRSPGGTLLVALPLSMAAYLLALLAFFAMEMLWVVQGSHPNNTATPPPAGHNFVENLDDRARMLAALQGSTHSDAPLLREQVKLSETQGIGMQVPVQPHRNELANFRPMEFDDRQRNVRWVFSHDEMRLHGYALTTGKPAGVLGVGAANAAFPAVALPGDGLPGMGEGDAVLVGGDTLYQYASATRQVWPRIRVGAGETLLGGGPVGETVAVMSDKAIYFLDGRALVENLLPVTPRLRVPMPGAMGDMRNLELIELIDGYLVTFLYSARSHSLIGAAPSQVALRIHGDGRVETINQRMLAFDYPAVYRYRGWWLSPPLYAVREAARNLFAPAAPLKVTAPAPMPRLVLWLGITMCLLSLLASVPMSAGRMLSKPARIAWIVACGALGLPALAALWLMVPLHEQVDALPLAQPAIG